MLQCISYIRDDVQLVILHNKPRHGDEVLIVKQVLVYLVIMTDCLTEN